MKQSRTISSLKNSISSVITYLILTITSFVSQTFFIKILGSELLGLNGLFTNILSMLSLFELGIGSAIIYNLYKPIANDDYEEVKSLLTFYKKAYNKIMLTIMVIGLAILPFVPKIVSDDNIPVNASVAYLLMLLSTVVSYFLTYKRSIIYAYQKEFIINIVHSIYLMILNSMQIVFLIVSKNYYIYLIIKIICQLIENIVLSIICNRLYPFIKERGNKLDKHTEGKILKKVKAMIFHKIGGIVVFSTDSLIINKFLGLKIVGINSNYNLIINSINNLVCKFIEALIPSVGNLIAQKNDDKVYEVFKITRFINFWISTVTAICLVLLLNPFIKIWLGEQYLLSMLVVIVLVVNYFQKSERYTYSTFKNSAGIWESDKHIPIIEAIVNLLVSIILANYIGLSGVYIGTIVSGLVVWLYGYPKYIYEPLFKRKYLQYIKETLKQFVVFVVIMGISLSISYTISVSNIIGNLLINLVIGLLVPNAFLIACYYKTNEFKYVLNMIIKLLRIINKPK